MPNPGPRLFAKNRYSSMASTRRDNSGSVGDHPGSENQAGNPGAARAALFLSGAAPLGFNRWAHPSGAGSFRSPITRPKSVPGWIPPITGIAKTARGPGN